MIDFRPHDVITELIVVLNAAMSAHADNAKAYDYRRLIATGRIFFTLTIRSDPITRIRSEWVSRYSYSLRETSRRVVVADSGEPLANVVSLVGSHHLNGMVQLTSC